MNLDSPIDVEDAGSKDSSEQPPESTTESLGPSAPRREDTQNSEERQQSTIDTNETESTIHNLGHGESSEDNATQTENAPHSKNEIDASLSPPTSLQRSSLEPASDPKDTRKRDSFLKRFTVFTGVAGQTAASSQRSSLYSISGFGDFRRFSLASSISSQVTEKSDESHSRFSKYISSFSGETFPNLDFSERNDTSVSGNIHTSTEGKTEDEQAISFQKRLKHIREITGTQVDLRAEEDLDSPQRPNDPRMWYTKNLRCASCMGACAVCNAACCMYEAGCRAKKDPKSGTFKAAQAERIVSNIEALGSHVRDNPTFIMCTLGGGCGRYICPECCGTCLNEACRDVQCKDCKPNPWGPCDWHDQAITYVPGASV